MVKNLRVVGVAALLAFGCASDDSPAISAQQASIIGGEISGPDDYANVVALRLDNALACSAVLVDEQQVLTAAHCVSGHQEWWSSNPRVLDVMVGTSAQQIAEVHRAAALCNLSGYDTDSSADNDVGRIQLKNPAAVAPTPINSIPVDRTWIGRQVTLVGFGPDFQQRGPQVRRHGSGIISAVEGASFVIDPMPAQGCSGDSGGAVFYESELGRVLVGIISRGPANCDGYTRAVSVDRHLEFAYASDTGSDAMQNCSEAAATAPVTSSCSTGPSGLASTLVFLCWFLGALLRPMTMASQPSPRTRSRAIGARPT